MLHAHLACSTHRATEKQVTAIINARPRCVKHRVKFYLFFVSERHTLTLADEKLYSFKLGISLETN